MKIIYDTKEHTLQKIKEFINEGYNLICPKCKSDLIIALTVEDANKFKVHPGIYCPTDESHVGFIVNLAEPHRRMREIINKFNS